MKFIKLKKTNSTEFKEAWKIYEEAFPEDERRNLKDQTKLMEENKFYSFYGVIKEENLVAIIAEWDFGTFRFIEHFAIKKNLRGKGIGTELLKNYLPQKENKVVLEVERPKDEISKKRISFYERLNFFLNSFDYIQPAYDENKKPLPMFIMSYPNPLSKEEFKLIRENLHLKVYGLKNPLTKI